MNLSPGELTGMEKEIQYFLSSSASGRRGRTTGANISSEKGARVARSFAPPDYHALAGGINHSKGHVRIGQVGDRYGAVHLGMTEGVGEAQVVFPNVLVIGQQPLLEYRVVPAVDVRHLPHGRKLDVHVVRGPAQHPVTSPGGDLQSLPAPD
jgi:hypothetical protein